MPCDSTVPASPVESSPGELRTTDGRCACKLRPPARCWRPSFRFPAAANGSGEMGSTRSRSIPHNAIWSARTKRPFAELSPEARNGMRSDRDSAPAPARLLSGALPPIALGAVGMLIAFYPTLLSKFERVQSDTGDTRFTNFVLEYEYRWLHGDPLARELWSPGIFFPEKNTLAYSDTFVSLLPFYAPWRSLGAKPDTAYQLFLLTVGGLNFIVAYLLLRNGFRRTVVGSSLGAFLFAFGSIRLNQLNHAQLLPQFYPLISLYGLVRIFQADPGSNSRHLGWWIALFFSGITAQLYADYYLAWFYLFALGLCCFWVVLNPDVRRNALATLRPKWKFLAIGFAAWI